MALSLCAGRAAARSRGNSLVVGPAIAARARVDLVGADAAVLATHAGTDAGLLQVEVVEGVLDLGDEAGHGCFAAV